MVSKREIKSLRKWLKPGYVKDISEMSGYSESSVEKFFCHRFYNLYIHQCAVELAEKNKNEFEILKQRVDAL